VKDLRNNLQTLKMETQNKLLVGNSEFQMNQKSLEETRSQTKKEEKEKELHEDKSKNIARETSQVVQSIKNVFTRCQATVRNRSVVAAAHRDATLSEVLTFNLDIIHARVSDLLEISAEYKTFKIAADMSTANSDLREGSGFTSMTGPMTGAPSTNVAGGASGVFASGGKSDSIRVPSLSKSTTSVF
jgi:hypothetical protein